MFYAKADIDLPDARLRALRQADAAEQTAAYAAGVREACRATLGGAAWRAEPVAEQGTFHRVFRAAAADGRRIVARIAVREVPAAERSLQLDACIHAALCGERLPGLAVFAVDAARQHAPFAYELVAEAEGASLSHLDDDEPRLQAALRELGRLLARVHALRVDGFGPLRVDGSASRLHSLRGACASWSDYLQASLDRHTAVCRNLGAITPYDVRRMERLFWHGDALPKPTCASLLHGDLGNHNVFGDGRRITALIDWEDAVGGDPVFDLAFWATFHPRHRHAWLIDAYRAVAPPLDNFEHRFWLYFLRIALAKTVVRHRLGIVDRPGRLPASHRIQLALAALESDAPLARAA